MNTVVEATDPLSFAQQRLWLLDGLLPIGSAYNVRHVLRLSGKLDTRALEQALNEIVRRHEALRTRFELIDGAPVQLIIEADPIVLKVKDLSSLPTEQRESAARSQPRTSRTTTIRRAPWIGASAKSQSRRTSRRPYASRARAGGSVVGSGDPAFFRSILSPNMRPVLPSKLLSAVPNAAGEEDLA